MHGRAFYRRRMVEMGKPPGRKPERRRHDPMPGSKEAIFEQLHSAGISPRQWGVIADDLDFVQDRAPRSSPMSQAGAD